MDSKAIEKTRIAMGTIPSEAPEKKTDIVSPSASIEVTIEDHSINPYKGMFCAATSTWGTNEFVQKWPITPIEGKLEVIKAVLTHNTLPQAKEMVHFMFRVKGVQRWLFDYHTQACIFQPPFMSIGCRDNNKLDADIVKIKEPGDEHLFNQLKEIYEFFIETDQGSWQSARSFLPQSYSHSYHFSQNLLSIVSTNGFHASKPFKDDHKGQALLLVYRNIQAAIGAKFPLIADYLEIMFSDAKTQKEIFEYIKNLKPKDLSLLDIELLSNR